MTNIDLQYERKFLHDFIASIKYLKHKDGLKMEHTGKLTMLLAKELGCESDELYFAGYYANVGLLMLENITSKQVFFGNEKEIELLRQHVHYSAEFLQRRGFQRSAEIVKNHHEKPNGMGYYAVANKDKDVAILNIADEFVGLSSTNHLRPPIVKDIAIKIALEEYERSSIFTYTEIDVIKELLAVYYHKITGWGL
jgi:response regulator RpfG family c-di-GMP phosphodiesterase